MEAPTLSFKVLALAPFLPDCENEAISKPLQVNPGELSVALKMLVPSLRVPLPSTLCPAGSTDLQIKAMKDFTPDGLIQSNLYLSALKTAANFLTSAVKKGMTEAEIKTGLESWPDLPDLKINIPGKRAPRKRNEDISSKVDDILSMVATPEDDAVTSSKVPTTASDLERILGQCLTSIFEYEPFRQLEAAWRGLALLMDQVGLDGEVKVEIFPCDLDSLETSLSNLLIHQVPDPPSLILVDIPFDRSPRCLDSIQKVAELSETMMAPTIVWVAPEFMGINTWNELEKLPFLPHHFENAAYAKWRRFGGTHTGRWLGVTGNRLLARYPYGADNQPRQVSFKERRALWLAPVWAVGRLICRSVTQTGWATRFVGMTSGSLNDLPLDMSAPQHPLPTETGLSDARIDQMIRAGMMPMVGVSGRDIAFLPSAVTVGKSTIEYQALVGVVARVVLWCKDTFENGLDALSLKRRMTEVFGLYWEQRGDPAPENLEISIGSADSEGKLPVRVEVSPSRHILPSGEKVELTLLW